MKYSIVFFLFVGLAPQTKIETDHRLAWDQVTSLTKEVISHLAKIQNGEVSLRRRQGGYFLTLKIVNGKSEASVSYPERQQ